MMNQTHPNPSQEAGYDDFWRSETGSHVLTTTEAISEGLDPDKYQAGVNRAQREHQEALAAQEHTLITEAIGYDEF